MNDVRFVFVDNLIQKWSNNLNGRICKGVIWKLGRCVFSFFIFIYAFHCCFRNAKHSSSIFFIPGTTFLQIGFILFCLFTYQSKSRCTLMGFNVQGFVIFYILHSSVLSSATLNASNKLTKSHMVSMCVFIVLVLHVTIQRRKQSNRKGCCNHHQKLWLTSIFSINIIWMVWGW